MTCNLSFTRSPKWDLWNFWSCVFLPPQWNYLRWLRQRRHFIWWWSTPAAVSERELYRACSHVAVVGSLMQKTTRESLPQPISQGLETVLDLNKVWGVNGWNEHDCCSGTTMCLSVPGISWTIRCIFISAVMPLPLPAIICMQEYSKKLIIVPPKISKIRFKSTFTGWNSREVLCETWWKDTFSKCFPRI